MAVAMFDTRYFPKFSIDPFSANSALKRNSIISMPSDLFFILRTVQLLRGITTAFQLKDFSLADEWLPYAKMVLKNNNKMY
jgi:aarF domain-containing kinase